MWRRLQPYVTGLRDGEGVAHAADREEVCVMRLAARLGVAWGGGRGLQAQVAAGVGCRPARGGRRELQTDMRGCGAPCAV